MGMVSHASLAEPDRNPRPASAFFFLPPFKRTLEAVGQRKRAQKLSLAERLVRVETVQRHLLAWMFQLRSDGAYDEAEELVPRYTRLERARIRLVEMIENERALHADKH